MTRKSGKDVPFRSRPQWIYDSPESYVILIIVLILDKSRLLESVVPANRNVSSHGKTELNGYTHDHPVVVSEKSRPTKDSRVKPRVV